jgi:hypothetical protein
MVMPKGGHTKSYSYFLFDSQVKAILLLPATASVRISQINDDFRFSKENQSLLVAAAAAAPFLV